MPDRPLLVTSALPYANGPLHLGHLAGAYLPADLFVRYQRLAGRDVVWVCGSDEHGAAIAIRARREGTTPRAIVDRYHAELAAAFEGFGIAFDAYGRTTSDVHRETSQDLFRAIDADGGFVRKTATQLYDPEAGLFLADRFVRGTCPVCGYDGAYGDQCENCGSSLSPDDLIEPTSTLSGAAPERRETTHWYLPLGRLQPALAEWIGGRAGWKPNVLGQVRSWLDAGLSDRAMTRDLDWGVPVPDEGAEGKVLYVWFDAPIGYLSITKEWAAAQGDADLWRRYWQVHPDGTAPELVHFIGKDNIVFHCLIFPAILMAANRAADGAANAAQPDVPRFVLPENVPANEFLNLEGQKLSTSRGWAVWASEALDAFPADALRYALAVGLPETKDADFSWSDFQNRVNGELADVVGNFCNRALTFADRFTGGAVPALEDPSEADQKLLADLAATPPEVGALYEQYRLRDAVARTVALARAGNQYLQETEPWKTRKTDERAMRNAVHVALQVCAGLSVLLDPVVPDVARRLREMLNLAGVRSSEGGAGRDGGRGGPGLGRRRAPAIAGGPRPRHARHPGPQSRGRRGRGAAGAPPRPRGDGDRRPRSRRLHGAVRPARRRDRVRPVHPARPAGGADRGGRPPPEGRQAPPLRRRPRVRDAADPVRRPRALRARRPRGQDGRRRGQLGAPRDPRAREPGDDPVRREPRRGAPGRRDGRGAGRRRPVDRPARGAAGGAVRRRVAGSSYGPRAPPGRGGRSPTTPPARPR